MIWTTEIPNKVGYYWWCNFWNGGVPTEILKVTKEDGKLWANGGEYCFQIEKKKRTKSKKQIDAELWIEGVENDGENSPTEFWCYIPEPEIPQIPCTHPIKKLTKECSSNTGNYDPSADDYFITLRCKCGESWYTSEKINPKEYNRLANINCKEIKNDK